jgi:hypothetical protein
MRATLATGVAAAAAFLVAGASAGPPAPLLVRVASTHEQPVAGQQFTGLTITPYPGTRIIDVHCGAKVQRKGVRGRLQKFYAPGVSGPASVACSWHVPANDGGKLLRSFVSVLTEQEPNGFVRRGTFSWRIKPSLSAVRVFRNDP